ncbi:mannose-1-phosphate guanylyltransferase/mannose-6-phosphate isomerase [Telmatospirillum sp. J64-1]|uniref:mannose-1-phosphate guanylyltransferase/mannose-6-phosphate isomerase n=1 Tax=Telmatospirillum sp. J64-1 TaxID=2502183 RepID=UPI00115C7599|nr:mannose-1-phosphate guanylyltransferase/mannose-6-phosphate isomerase [Telmatospirillum sp. J64-1]
MATNPLPPIRPVILSGGIGSRLWPLSRAMWPKQFLPLASGRAMLVETAERSRGATFAAPLVVCARDHGPAIAEMLDSEGISPCRILLEPQGRNTAPAVAVAALAALEEDEDALLLVMPSDHLVADRSAFLEAIDKGRRVAAAGRLVAFGCTPQGPHTGYGYIRAGAPLDHEGTARIMDGFTEKPDLETSKRLLAEGGHFWNSGIFLFPARLFLSELQNLCPALLQSCQSAFTAAQGSGVFLALGERDFIQAPSLSVDVAVMERTDKGAMLPVDMGWSDVGSWQALWDVSAKDEAGNVAVGDVLLRDTSGSYVRSEGGPFVAVVGLRDVVVVSTDDAVLVSAREHVDQAKEVVEELRARGRAEHDRHPLVRRPWGSYTEIDVGERFKVKQILVKAGASLSLQYHHHRAEHWVVVEGTARVTCGDKTFLLHENESTFIPAGIHHRLENPGKIPLRLIEVQSGSYLDEDDIVRLDDRYGR